MKALLQTKKSLIAGAKCELVILYYRDVYETHPHSTKWDWFMSIKSKI